jgi:outer membrane protein
MSSTEMAGSRMNADGSQGKAPASARRHDRACWPTRTRFAACCVFAVVCHVAAGESHAEAADAGSEAKFVTGRLGAGALVDSRYSGAAGYRTFPVPLASLEIGDFAYIDYWQAGLYFLSNQQKTLGLAIVATPRLGFNSSDGSRLAGMMTRKSSIESGLSIDSGWDNTGVSLGYLHDITGASNGGLVRLLVFKRMELTDHIGVDAFVGLERLSAKVANYYYGVGSNEATAARPFYQPRTATDVNAGLHFNYDFGRNSTLLFGYEATRLSDALANSPIVERRMTNLFYLGYGWRL